MGDKISLHVEARQAHGKKVRTLRRQGLTPAVVYGAGIEPLSVQADAGEVRRVVTEAGTYTPVHLLGAKRRIAMIKDVEYDPTRAGVIRHVSFHAVNADELVLAEVPIRLLGLGESEAERAGLVILQALDKVEVRALPMDLPDALEVSVLELREAGDRITVGDIAMPSDVEIVERVDESRDDDDEERQTIADLVVANVYEPGALHAANEAAGTTSGEASSDKAAEVVEESTDTGKK